MISTARTARPGVMLALALGLIALLTAGCGEEAAVAPTATTASSPTAAASPTDAPTALPTGVATGVATPTPTATGEPADPTRPPGHPTGIDEVDRVIAAVLAFDGDYAELDALVRYTDTACTLALGGGGPPKCWDIPGAAQVEGTPVVVFPFSVCEGEWEPRTSTLARVLGMLVERPPSAASAASDVTLEVYGVFPVPADAEPSDRPAGDYAVVFATHVDDGLSGTTVRIADGGIVRIAFGCGSTFPAVMAAAFAGQSLQPPLGGLGLASDAVIATVEELPPRAVQDTSPRWRVVIDLVAPVAGYRAVLVDDRTALLHADRSVATVEELVPGMSVAVSGVPLPWSLWRADEIVIGD